jgi:hypothetical protein
MEGEATFRVMALHALAYCERLFYLEEVEELRVADERVWAGRVLHQELDEPGEVVGLTLESEHLGLRGRVDGVQPTAQPKPGTPTGCRRWPTLCSSPSMRAARSRKHASGTTRTA